MFIIDFDDTLFDTHAYKMARLSALLSVGVDETLFWKTYEQARNTPDGRFSYSDDRHAAVLATCGKDEHEILQAFDSVNNRVSEFTQPDAIGFLDRLKQTEHSLVLLSLGDEAFQEMKTRKSGLHDYFDRVFMVDRTKRDVIAELRQTEEQPLWFVNDKVSETQEMLKMFPDIYIALKVSPKFERTEYEQSGLPYFDTLTEIADYVTT